MATIARAINQFRSGNFKNELKQAVARRVEHALACGMRWLLSHREVQQVIADAFASGTPMCGVLSGAIEDALSSATIDCDNVEGLGRMIDESIENAVINMSVDAENIEGLDIVVERIVGEEVEKLTDDVAQVLAERMTGR